MTLPMALPSHLAGLAEVDARILPQPKLQYSNPACLDVGTQVSIMGERWVGFVYHPIHGGMERLRSSHQVKASFPTGGILKCNVMCATIQGAWNLRNVRFLDAKQLNYWAVASMMPKEHAEGQNPLRVSGLGLFTGTYSTSGGSWPVE